MGHVLGWSIKKCDSFLKYVNTFPCRFLFLKTKTKSNIFSNDQTNFYTKENGSWKKSSQGNLGAEGWEKF